MPSYSPSSTSSGRGFEPRNFLGPALLAGMLAIGIFIGYRLAESEPLEIVQADEILTKSPGRQVTGRLDQVLRYIDSKYIDEYTIEELEERAIVSLLKDLDPHSRYISRDNLSEINAQLDGHFEGIGVEFALLKDTVVVLTVLEGGPAEAAGIKPGDRLVTEGDSLLAGQGTTTQDIVKRIKGEKGTLLHFGVIRGNDPTVLKIDITRGEVPIHSIPAAFMLDDNTIYMAINRFNSNTYKEFVDHMEQLQDSGQVQNLILDLRNNPGGYLDQAINILNQLFSESEKVLMYMEGDHSRRSERKTTGRDFFNIGNVAVLINGESASASEIVAGAIQDWDRGIVVGRQSFGKGLVQEQYNLSDGSALRLTIAKYFTPSGRCIQKPFATYWEQEASDQDQPDFEPAQDATPTETELASFALDTTRTYSTASGRPVLAGGGITPDIEVTLDTNYYHPALLFMRRHSMKCVATLPKRYHENLPESVDDFLSSYQLPAEMAELFENFAETYSSNLKPTGADFPPRLKETLLDPMLYPEFENEMLMALAKMKYGEEAMYRIFIKDDEDIEQAMRALARKNPLTINEE